jgi:hypothetical protein
MQANLTETYNKAPLEGALVGHIDQHEMLLKTLPKELLFAHITTDLDYSDIRNLRLTCKDIQVLIPALCFFDRIKPLLETSLDPNWEIEKSHEGTHISYVDDHNGCETLCDKIIVVVSKYRGKYDKAWITPYHAQYQCKNKLYSDIDSIKLSTSATMFNLNLENVAQLTAHKYLRQDQNLFNQIDFNFLVHVNDFARWWSRKK